MNAEVFTWATGIEDTFIPQARPGLRALDEYALTQHYTLWKEDLDRAAESGARALRWGIPWYRVQPEPHHWDWRWTDEVLEYMVCQKGLTPILDLMHYGTPLWLENSFINASYPQRVSEYATAVAQRYHTLVRYYTPMNEPMVAADFCGRRAEWPPYLSGDDGYVKVLTAVARGMTLTAQALHAEQPGSLTVQVEALWYYWTRSETLRQRVELNNQAQYLCFDLATGRVDEQHPLYAFLCRHGFSAADLIWFQEHAVQFDLFGANFYPWSYGEVAESRRSGWRALPKRPDGGAIAEAIQQAHRRYDLPVMVTETSANADLAGRARWMDETVMAVRELRAAGVPVVGYTWFPLLAMVDWAYRRGRRPLKDYLIHLGLYDSQLDADGILQRQPTPLLAQYRRHTAAPMPPLNGETHARA